MTSYCHMNLTIGVFHNENGGLFIVNDKSISGTIGTSMDKLIAGKDKRNCRFVRLQTLGSRFPNGTYSGAKKMLLENKIDMYGRSEDLITGENENLFTLSNPCYAEKLHLGHFLDHPKSTNVNSLSFLEHSKFIANSLYLGFVILAIVIFISYLVPTKNIRLAFKNTRSYFKYYPINRRLFNKRNFTMVFLVVFTQLNINIISSSIKTNDVIIELNDVIYNKEELNKTKKHACWLKSEAYFAAIVNSNDNSIFHRVYKEKRKSNGEMCYLDDAINDIRLIADIDLNQSFFLMVKTGIYILFSFVTLLKRVEKIAIESEFFDFELIQVHYLSPYLNENIRDKLLDKILSNSESGFYVKFYTDIGIAIKSSLNKIDNIYTSVTQIKDDFVKIDNLKFEYFKSLFIILMITYLILFFIFIMHKSSKFIGRKFKEFKFHFYEYSFNIQIRFVIRCPLIRFNYF